MRKDPAIAIQDCLVEIELLHAIAARVTLDTAEPMNAPVIPEAEAQPRLSGICRTDTARHRSRLCAIRASSAIAGPG